MDEALQPGHRRAAGAADVPALRRAGADASRSPRASTPRPVPPSARSSSTPTRAVELAGRGEQVILVRRETNPDDLHGMIAAAGHPDLPRRQDLPRRRRRPRHGQDLRLRRRGPRRRHPRHEVHRADGGVVVDEGDVDLDRRHRRRGLPRRGRRSSPSPVVQYFEGDDRPARPTSWSRPSHRIMTHADEQRRLGVRANADTAEDAARARRFGAARASACAAPSTCSSASAGSWSSG